MDSTMRAKVLTMAAAALGLSVVGGCAKKAPEEPAAEASSGAESAPAEGASAAGTAEEGAAQGGGEMGCSSENGCHAAK